MSEWDPEKKFKPPKPPKKKRVLKREFFECPLCEEIIPVNDRHIEQCPFIQPIIILDKPTLA